MKKLILLIIPFLLCCGKQTDNLTLKHKDKIETTLNEYTKRSYESITITLLKHDENTNTYYYKVECIIIYSGVYYEENYYIEINEDSVKFHNLRYN